MQLAPSELHRTHWYASAIGSDPVHTPGLAVSVCPASGVPAVVGRDAFSGGAPGGGGGSGVWVGLGVTVGVGVRVGFGVGVLVGDGVGLAVGVGGGGGGGELGLGVLAIATPEYRSRRPVRAGLLPRALRPQAESLRN